MNALSAALFWQFSCASYALPNIKELLLSLQDKHNKNINLCLLLLYLEQQKIQLTPIQVKALADLCSDIDAQTLLQHRQIAQTHQGILSTPPRLSVIAKAAVNK